MKKFTFLAFCFFIFSCQKTENDKEHADTELLKFINKKTEYTAIEGKNLPKHIKKYQPLILHFLKEHKFNPSQYYVSGIIHSWTEDTITYSDTSVTGLSLRLYHLNYFRTLLQAEEDYSKDSTVTYMKGNIGGKNFSISINKKTNTISGPHYWK
ncbi:MAG: hypothetical protein JST26_13240 [Bacteroidetes bacterium]|nr:hypothetical protein [Bacteroidota bacterium]